MSTTKVVVIAVAIGAMAVVGYMVYDSRMRNNQKAVTIRAAASAPVIGAALFPVSPQL